MNAMGSCVLRPKSMLESTWDIATHPATPADQDRAHGLLKDKLHDFSAVSSKSHADADLVHAPAYAVGHHSIYSDRSRQHC
jgi:hypothetical protein